MKKKIMKSTLAVALVAAAAFGGAKTYGAYAPVSQSELLLSENVEALSEDFFTELLCSVAGSIINIKVFKSHYLIDEPSCLVEKTKFEGEYPEIYPVKYTVPGHKRICNKTDDESQPTSCTEKTCTEDHS